MKKEEIIITSEFQAKIVIQNGIIILADPPLDWSINMQESVVLRWVKRKWPNFKTAEQLELFR